MKSERKHIDIMIDGVFVVTTLVCVSIAFYKYIYLNLQKSNRPIGAILCGVSCIIVMYIYHYFYLKKTKTKKIEERKIYLKEYYKKCKECVVNKIKNESFLAYYNLLTLEELLKIENSLEYNDTVIIYTSHIDTEDEAEVIVKNNISKGVIYNILYYDGTIEKADKLKNMGYKNVFPMEQNENNFDYQMSKKTASGFDLMFYKKKGVINAFFCVNFSIGVCNKYNVSGCSNPCLKSLMESDKNKYLFYKKIDDALANSLFVTLGKIIEIKADGKK